jgi:xanthine dehydrogenase iron-sulfur cluster and FAD-binding subunit A
VKPVAFDYFDPATVDETVGLLREHGEGARALAGGQSLVPLMNFRLVRPHAIVDLNRVAGLGYVSERAGGLEHPDPTDAEIREAVSGNLCRCTGDLNIERAVRRAAVRLRDATPGA